MRVSSFVLFLVGLTSALAGVDCFHVPPRDTDPRIGEEFNAPHYVYVNRAIVATNAAKAAKDRHQLLLFLTGTNGSSDNAASFCSLAADLGYHVINLTYPDRVPASVCAGDPNPAAFAEFRMAVIAGSPSKHIAIDAADCIENRLIKLLQHLGPKHPDEDWGQFLSADGTLNWAAIAVAGHSQGGGHAALIGIKHRVARVICTGAPKDYSRRLDAPAAWYNAPSATPKDLFFTFNHRQDPKACTPQQQLRNLAALGLNEFGPPVDAAVEAFPYRHSRILLSSYPQIAVEGPKSRNATIVHCSVIVNANASRWEKVWTYLLTEEPR